MGIVQISLPLIDVCTLALFQRYGFNYLVEPKYSQPVDAVQKKFRREKTNDISVCNIFSNSHWD